MDIRHLMSYVYPMFSASLFVLLVLEMLRYLIIRREHIQVTRALFVGPLLVAISLLTLTTGLAPVFSIDVLRPYIVYARITAAIMANVLNGLLIVELIKVLRSRHK